MWPLHAVTVSGAGGCQGIPLRIQTWLFVRVEVERRSAEGHLVGCVGSHYDTEITPRQARSHWGEPVVSTGGQTSAQLPVQELWRFVSLL